MRVGHGLLQIRDRSTPVRASQTHADADGVVIKPSEFTSTTTLALGWLATEAGLSDGVFALCPLSRSTVEVHCRVMALVGSDCASTVHPTRPGVRGLEVVALVRPRESAASLDRDERSCAVLRRQVPADSWTPGGPGNFIPGLPQNGA